MNCDVSFLIGALGAGMFIICMFVGWGLMFYTMDRGLKLRKRGKKQDDRA